MIYPKGEQKSTKGWLVNKGIMSDRIEIIGFGEKQLENYCEDNGINR